MLRAILFLFLSVFVSCSLSSPSFPEEYLLDAQQMTLKDFQTMLDEEFDFTTLAPTGKVYLEYLLSHPQPITKDFLQILIDKKIINLHQVFGDGRTVFNYVLSNPGDVSLEMAHILLATKDKNFFLGSSYSPLLDAIHNKGKISYSLINLLLQEGVSINTPNAITGVTPALEYFKSYTQYIPELQDYMIKNINVSITDKQKQNIWHYLFANDSNNFLPITEKLLQNPKIYSLLLKPDKKNIYPIDILAKNPSSFTFTTYQRIKNEYKDLWQKQSWVDQIFLYSLTNNGPALKGLFLDIIAKKPNVNALNFLGQNSLLVAVQNTSESILPILQYLIKYRVNIYQLDNQKHGVLYYTVLNKGLYTSNLLLLLEKEGVSLSVEDDSGKNLTSYIVLNEGPGAQAALDLLVTKGLPILTPNKYGELPLALLFKNPSEEALMMLRALIYSSYQGKKSEPYSQNIIFDAAQSSSFYAYKMMLTLIQQGFNINPQNNSRQNALFYTVQNRGSNALRMTRLLLMKGLSPDSVDKDGNNLLIYALNNKVHRFSMVNLLLKWGTDPFRSNIFGKSPAGIIKSLPKKERERYRRIFTKYHIDL